MESIEKFFAGRSVFVTGGTGFIGKVLIEKLIRSCPDLKSVYVLIRGYKNKSPVHRLNEMFELPLFERIKREQPNILERKVKIVEGDITKLNLGISEEDEKSIIEDVSVIFHGAASVRFDQPLQEAILLNTRGTREVVYLAKRLRNLASFVHISTTYCNCDRLIVDEVIYPSPVSWRDAIYIAETADPVMMQLLTAKYLGVFPNTYTLTKNLSEQLINEECKDMPSVIFRPSIVISSASEPVPGWMDSFNGPVGLLIGVGKGIIRVVVSRKTTVPDYMPVDIAVKGIIVAAWKMSKQREEGGKSLTIYNASTGSKSISMKELVDMGMAFSFQYPMLQTLWYPSVILTPNMTCFYANVMLKQVLPAYCIDALTSFVKMNGKKISIMKIQRKVFVASTALAYFTSRSWYFVNNNFVELIRDINDVDKEAFDFSFEHIDPNEFLLSAVRGGHKYLLHDNMENLPKAIARMKRLYIMDRGIKLILGLLLAYYLYGKLIASL